MRNRPDNWSTKRLTKSTWTPLMYLLRFEYYLKKKNRNLRIGILVVTVNISVCPTNFDEYCLVRDLMPSKRVKRRMICYFE